MSETSRNKRRKKRINPFAVFFIVIIAIAGCFLFSKSSYFNVVEYQVEGNYYYNDQEIQVLGNCKTDMNLIWDIKTKDIATRLEKDPYMESVEVKRSFPNKVIINISERRQMAAVIYGSNYVVIDAKGTVLRKTSVEPKLTVMGGITMNKLSLGEVIGVEEKVLFRQAMEIIQTAEAKDMYFKRMEITSTGVDCFVLDRLMCKGSPESIISSIKSGKLQLAIESLFDKKIERGVLTISGDNYISFTPKID